MGLTSSSNSSRGSRKVVLGSIATLGVLVIGLLAWRARADRTPGPDASPDAVRRFVASDRFNDLPPEEKDKYLKDMSKLVEPGEEQQKAMRNMARAHQQKMLDDYFALPEGRPRQDHLDRQIDQQETIRKMIDAPSTQPGERIMVRRGGPGAQKEMAEGIPAEYQAKMAQYMKDLKDRRAARGLSNDGHAGAFMITIGK
jgi:hypothetical protein